MTHSLFVLDFSECVIVDEGVQRISRPLLRERALFLFLLWLSEDAGRRSSGCAFGGLVIAGGVVGGEGPPERAGATSPL